jgi:LysR family glycine cleavage system transcriptional activator
MRSLEAFEAVSRHLSISKAASELGVTQSAVSHQLRYLSEELGEKLVATSGGRVELTSAGRQFADAIQSAFGQIDRSIAETIGADRHTVRLAVCSSFAPGWLIGRIASFHDLNPNVALQLRMYAKDPELTDAVADAFVTTLPKVGGFWSMRIRPELLAPIFAASKANLVPGKLPLITTTLDPARFGDDWTRFCDAANIAFDTLHTGQWLQVSHYVMAYDMAKAGLGLALVPDFLAEEDVAAGRLRYLSPARLPTSEDYYLCVKRSRQDELGLRAVVRWFRAQVAKGGFERSVSSGNNLGRHGVAGK